MCIWNGVTQLAKAWPVNMRLEVRACERRGTVNMQQKVSYSEPVHVVSVMWEEAHMATYSLFATDHRR